PSGLQPVNGWAGVYDSGPGQFDLGRMKLARADVNGDGRDDIVSMYGYPDGSARAQLFSGAANLALTGGAGGITYLPPGALSWGASVFLGGDWDGDRKGDLASLESRDDGTTHAGILRSTGTAFAWTKDAWVTPAAEIARTTCAGECWPLLGRAHNGGPIARRPLVVKIDNHPSARPHYGIAQADIVFEVLVEAYLTRLAAIFHSQDPDEIGGIRSGRLADRQITPMVRGALVYSGATIEETEAFRNDAAAGAYFDMDAGIVSPSPYYRVPFRPNPYNMFSRSSLLREALNRLPGGGDPVTVPAWDFLKNASHAATAGGFGSGVYAGDISIGYRTNFGVLYRYDPATRTYMRWQAGVREVDAHDARAIAPKNVVIVYTDVWETNVIQDIFGSRGLDMRLSGTGMATIFRDGLRVDGSWGKPGLYDPFRFYTRDGARIYLSPGQTWVHILPSSWQVTSN
ncbi:MAG TPA: DUF3048 domain-containing protein, partial [Candidatus Limnocylindria bacterium]|nr:DUF3048 domain-containing protein [Candidatus Limnocylindria bacterium]